MSSMQLPGPIRPNPLACTSRIRSARALAVTTYCSYNACVFTWDEKKRKLNLAKHGVDFLDASIIFDGPLVTVEDTR